MTKYSELNNQQKIVLLKFFKEDAKNDGDPDIRLAFYRQNGFSEDAKNDKSSYIRMEARIWFDYLEKKI